MNAKQTQGISLMFLSLGILILPGLVVNNLTNNNLITSSQTQTCDQTLSTCVLNTPVGCQVSVNNCNLQGSAFQFLNQCSPFSNLLSLNFLGFVASFFSQCQNGALSVFPQTLPGQTVSVVIPTISANETFSSCSIVSKGNSIGSPWVLVKCTAQSPTLSGLTMPINATLWPWNQVVGNTPAHSVPSYAITSIVDSSANKNWLQANCLAYGAYNGIPGDPSNTITSLICNTITGLGVLANTQTNSSTFNLSAGSLLSFGLTIIGLALVLFVGLGIGISYGGSILGTGGSVGLTTNPQGTKLAQVFGIGMLTWGIFYGEFGTWFTSGYLPYGFDGAAGIASIVLSACFFFGVWGLSQSGSVAQ